MPSPPVASWPEPWVIPFRFWISDFMKWLINDFDLGLFTFKELTRSVAWLLEWPLRAAQSLLAEGFSRGIGRDAVEVFPGSHGSPCSRCARSRGSPSVASALPRWSPERSSTSRSSASGRARW